MSETLAVKPQNSLKKWYKPLLFAIYAALGCLAAAALGEIWLAMMVPRAVQAPPPPPPPTPTPVPTPTPLPPMVAQAVVLVLDTSGSMYGDPLDQMKQAALAYISRQDMRSTRISVVHFDDSAEVSAPLTNDATVLNAAITNLQIGTFTRMDLGLSAAARELENASEQRNILLFTDGQPTGGLFGGGTPEATRQVASSIRGNRIRLLAIATGDADRNYLQELTGDPSLVFQADAGQFGEAFRQAERVIAPPRPALPPPPPPAPLPETHQIIESAPVQNSSLGFNMVRIGVWTGLLGLGIAVALLLAQKRYSHQAFSAFDSATALGGLLTGCLAGGLSQILYESAADSSALSFIGRLAAWALLGGGMGLGTAQFIPNLPAGRASLGGLIGGVAGALGFLMAAAAAGDVAGRLLGAALVGFFIGLMVVLAEVAFRKAWLRVSYGPADQFDMTLGETPLTVGSNRSECRIYAREALPLAARYSMAAGGVCFEDIATGAQTIVPAGDERRFGHVTITVLGEAVHSGEGTGAKAAKPAATPAPAPMAVPPVFSPPAAASPASAPPFLIQAPAPPAAVALTPEEVLKMTSPEGVWSLRPTGSVTAAIALPPAPAQATIGRAPGNTIVLDNQFISSQHARLTIGKQMLTITDLGSTNGTAVNGKPLAEGERATLRAGDLVKLGHTEYRVELA